MLPLTARTCLFTILALSARIVAGDDDLFKDSSVLVLNKDKFSQLDSSKAHFIKFYAPWCGHCQRLAPTWEELADKFNKDDSSKVLIGKVDCTEHSELCSQHEVSGYPTLKFFAPGSKSGEKYRGARELDALSSWALEKVDEKKSGGEEEGGSINGLHVLTDESFDKHVAEGKHFIKFYAPWCGHCKNLAPTWDKLASELSVDEQVKIGKVDCTQFGEICKKFEVRGYPTLLWIENGKKVDKYSGSRGMDDLSSYVKKMSVAKREAKEEAPKEPTEEKAPLLLTKSNFDEEIASGVTFVKFYAPWCGHCRNLAPTWADLSRKMPSAKIAKVDCTEHEDVCNDHEVQGYPTLILFKDGSRVEEYNGSRDLDALQEFVARHIDVVKKDEL